MEGDVRSDSGLSGYELLLLYVGAMEYGSREKHLIFSAWLEPEGYCGYCGMGFISILLGPSWYFLFCISLVVLDSAQQISSRQFAQKVGKNSTCLLAASMNERTL